MAETQTNINSRTMAKQTTSTPCFYSTEDADRWIDRNCTRCKKRWSERAGSITAFHCRIQSDILKQMIGGGTDEIRAASHEATQQRTCPAFIDRMVPPRWHWTRRNNPNQLTLFNNDNNG